MQSLDLARIDEAHYQRPSEHLDFGDVWEIEVLRSGGYGSVRNCTFPFTAIGAVNRIRSGVCVKRIQLRDQPGYRDRNLLGWTSLDFYWRDIRLVRCLKRANHEQEAPHVA